jgi:hypothetical protein
MIALQARGPQLPSAAAQTAKFVNMMNMTKQQEAAERQAAQAQQAMTLAQKKDAREEALQGPALTKAEIDNVRAQIDDLEEQYKMVSTDEGHQFWLNRVRKISPEIADQIGMFAPAFDREKVNNIMLTAKQAVDKIDPDAKATIEYAGKGGVDEQGNPVPEGTAIQVITGSKPSTRVIRNAPNAAAPAPIAAPQTPTAGAGTNMRATQGANTTPQDLIQQGMDPRNIPSGMPTVRPASFNQSDMGGAGQMTPQMVPAILDSAVNTGVMAQIDLDQMLAMTPPQARQGIMDVIRSNKIALQADAPSLAASGMGQQQPPMAPNPVQRPDAGFAVYRGGQPPQSRTANLDGDMSMMRNTEVQYQPLQRRDPNVSPLPGSSLVAPQVLGSQKAAETAGSENVKVGTEPRIVAGTERAKRLEKLRGEMPVAKAETQTLVNSLTGRINAIDEYLRSGSRNSIIGAIEGRIPRALQSETRADAQGLYDYITSNTVLQKLIDDRGQTETGGSPQGVVSDADLKVAAQASTKLTQTGSERKQEIEMQRLRDELYRTREQAIQKYNNVYREVMKEAPELRLKVRTVAPKYKSAPQTSTKRKPLQNIFGG